MKHLLLSRWSGIAILCLCLVFIVCAIPWIDKPGIQTDEALFADGLGPRFDERKTIRIFNHQFPLMVMTYVGALKSYLWAALFWVWSPSPASMRTPAILLGALSIWLVYCLVSSTINKAAGLAVCALLATDPIYILYSRLDHGPVVIQHLCLIVSVLALVRFYERRRIPWLVLSFFMLGLGLWDKAVFAWLILGLTTAGMTVWWGDFRKLLTLRNVAIAAAAFAVGSAPLIIYNVRNGFVTFRSNTVWSSQDIGQKATILKSTLQGDVLFGSMIREPWDGPPREPVSRGERAVVTLAASTNMQQKTGSAYLFFVSILLIPFTRNKAACALSIGALLCGVVAWLQMAFTQGAGGAAHHTILLWPLPAIVSGVVLTTICQRLRMAGTVLPLVLVVACISNMLVLSTYYSNLVKYGGTDSWTDAMYPALNTLRDMRKDGICTVDWGFASTVRLFEGRRTNVFEAAVPADDQGKREALAQVSQAGVVFLSHTVGHETIPGTTAKLVLFANENGYQRVNHRLFADTNGRETTEIFQFALGGFNNMRIDP